MITKFIVSQGGCSTHGIIDWLKIKTPIYIDGDQINMHRREPNAISFIKNGMAMEKKIPYPLNSKVLYILANPYDYTIYCLSKPKTWNIHHFSQTESDYKFIEKKHKLIEYLKDPYDAFKYREHTENYLNNDSREYKLMFVKYESLKNFDIIKKIKNFWDLPETYPDFIFKRRKSDWNSSTDEIKELLSKKYKNDMEWYMNLPDYCLLGEHENII
jgi:hypothetical protein